MKALTVRQPWASLIMSGMKDVENRTYRIHHRGRLVIHAAKAVTEPALEKYRHLLDDEPPRGVVLGTVEIVDCVQDSDSEWADHGSRIRNWIVKDPVAFAQPIKARGQQGLSEWHRRTGAHRF